jgi:hypothetical protein
MAQPLDERIAQRVKETRIDVDDYTDTIHAIIGFVNLYLLDDKTFQPRPQVKGFQGRHLSPLPTEEQTGGPGVEKYVSPDLGIVIEDSRGILGEVKKNFPKEVERAQKEFVQLKGYDLNLTGWPTVSERVESHEVVLLVHLTTSAYAKEFYEEHLPQTGIVFERPFSIVEFGRQEQVQHYFFLKTVLGQLTEIGGEKKLKYGVSVPMRVLLHEYAKTLLYDARPPLPYLAEIIWRHVCTPIASENPKFEHLRENQKIEVALAIEGIVERLNEGFSFSFWHSQYPERQPRIPRTEWVKQACQFLVESGEAEWVKGGEETELIIFYRKYDDPKEHFNLSHATLEEKKTAEPMLPGFEPTETPDRS